MSTNPSPSQLDASQTLQRAFEESFDAHRVDVINTVPITTTNNSVGLNGTTAPTSSTEIAGKDPNGNLQPVSVTTTGVQNVYTLNSLVPVSYDYVAVVNVSSGNGIGQPQTVTYKTGGSGGTQTALLSFTYNSDNSLATVAKT